jgi:endoribonuclease Dicer
VLDTGTGKTLIALMLMKHMHAIDIELKMKRVTIFLVPAIPLVTQQARYIENNSDLKVLQFCGSMGCDSVHTFQ